MEILDKGQEGSVPCPVIATTPSFICVTAKSPKAKAQFVLPETCTIQQFKEDIAKRFNCETSQLVLVFFGRILKDQATLRQCGINDGMTVHLVIRSQQRDPEDPPQLPYVPGIPPCTQAPSHSTLGSAPFGLSTQGSWGPPEANLSSSEWPPVPTSEMIIQKVREVILANPEIQQLAQQVPSIGHILNNADIMRVILDKMREIMDLARNPEMVQDLKGSSDQALVSLQSNIPGGDNPLRQLNSEMQEPGLSPGQDCFVTNPYATLVRSPCWYPEQGTLRVQGPLLESQDCLPPYPLASQSTTSICSDEGGFSPGWVHPPGHSPSVPHLAQCSGMEPFSTGCVRNPDPAEIPMMIVNLCNAYTKRMMISLLQNALLASQNAQAGQQEQIQDQVTSLSQQMQSPAMTAAMSNPTAIQAWVQMEQGLQTLLAEAPVLIPWFMLRLRGLEGVAGGGSGPGTPSCQRTATAE